MAKKYRTKKEKEALMLKGLKIGGLIFALVLALTILFAAVVPPLVKSPRFNYFFNPWDDGICFDAFTKNELFAYSTAIEAIEENKGFNFSEVACRYLAVDLSAVEPRLQQGLKGYFGYWAKKNDKELIFATKQELKDRGLILDDGKDTFQDGYLLEFHDNNWSEQRDRLVVNYYFHHANFDGRGYTVTVNETAFGWEAEEYIRDLYS